MNYSDYAKEGIGLWLNNKPIEAEAHFSNSDLNLDDNTSINIQVQTGHTFVVCMVRIDFL